jgi:hypothetical protein
LFFYLIYPRLLPPGLLSTLGGAVVLLRSGPPPTAQA